MGYGYELEAAVSKASVDPLGEDDTFSALLPPLLCLLSQPVEFNVDKKREELLALESTTLLLVRLVGFSEDRHRLTQLESQLIKYISALNPDVHANVTSRVPHWMMAKTWISVEIERIQGDLGEKIHNAIHQSITKVDNSVRWAKSFQVRVVTPNVQSYKTKPKQSQSCAKKISTAHHIKDNCIIIYLKLYSIERYKRAKTSIS